MEGYISHLMLLYLYHCCCCIFVIALVGALLAKESHITYMDEFVSTYLAMVVSIMIIFSYDGANSDYVSTNGCHLDCFKSNSINKFKDID
jgi:hypothetical protein